MTLQGYQPLGEYTFPESFMKLIRENSIQESLDSNVLFLRPEETSQYLYYIESGKVLLGIWNAKGEERLIEILGPGNFCGSSAILADIPGRIFLQTDAPTVLLKVSKATVMQLIGNSKEFREVLIRYVSKILIRMTVLVEGLTFLSCKERIYQLLKVSMDATQTSDQLWHPLTYPYSKTDISRIVGASRSTVSRLFGELCDEGLVRDINRSIQVKER